MDDVCGMIDLIFSLPVNEFSLLQAIRKQNILFIKYLLEHRVDINFNFGIPLQVAVRTGNIKIVQFLLDQGVHTSHNRERVFQIAVENNYIDIISLLLKYENFPLDKLCNIAIMNEKIDVMKLVFDRGLVPKNYLNEAVANKKIKVIEFLLNLGCDIYEALKKAIYEGHANVVEYLLDRGADIHVDKDFPIRETIDKFYMIEKAEDVLETLIRKGADKQIGLIEAIRFNNLTAIEMLLQNGAEVTTNIIQMSNQRIIDIIEKYEK